MHVFRQSTNISICREMPFVWQGANVYSKTTASQEAASKEVACLRC